MKRTRSISLSERETKYGNFQINTEASEADLESASADCEANSQDGLKHNEWSNSGRRPYKKAWHHTETFKEDHGQNLFAIQFNQHCADQQTFAVAGANRLSIYECLRPRGIKLLRMYIDPAEDECFYSCAWTVDRNIPLIAVAGKRGVIRIIYPTSLSISSDQSSFTGHGSAVNHLTFSPKTSHILLSASKDHDMRLWNIKTCTCLAIFGGVEGHMDEVLYAEFSMDGNRIVSSGMDHFLKVWNLDLPKTKAAIENSGKYDAIKTKVAFEPHRDHFPVFSTRDIHKNYIDCVLDFGRFIISKSCENEVVLWTPGSLDKQPQSSKVHGVTIMARLPVKDCDIWFMRVSLDREKKIMALGNRIGKIALWDLDVDDPKKIKMTHLSHPSCTSVIRQTAFSVDGKTLVCCCDDGSVWRWDKQT